MAVSGGLTNGCEKKRSEKERYTHLNAEFQRIARRDKKAFLTGSSKKQKSSRKASISALLTMPKPLTMWITKNCGKF